MNNPDAAKGTRRAYFLDGEEISEEKAREMALASEFRKPDAPAPLCFTLKAENVFDIRGAGI